MAEDGAAARGAGVEVAWVALVVAFTPARPELAFAVELALVGLDLEVPVRAALSAAATSSAALL